MTIQLLVRWPNAGHPLLQNPIVGVTADEAPISASSSAPGRFTFTIPDGTASVELKVEFKPTLRLPDHGDVEFGLLRADQAYRLDGTTLEPDTRPFRLVNGEVIAQNIHPLVDTVSAGNAPAGLTIAEVRTEFVDIGPVWRKRETQDYRIYQADTEREITFVPIGATGAQPALWFAFFPIGLEPPTPEVGTLVFFRPNQVRRYSDSWSYPYFEEPQGALNRYFLAPRDEGTPLLIGGQDAGRPTESLFYIKWEAFLRCSFQRALLRSGKPIVLLHPWPNPGPHFEEAQTAKLPTLANGILRMLRGMGHLGGNHPTVSLGRLGLSGFSAAGPPTCAALRANMHTVKELYLFDPMHIDADAPSVIQWARGTPGFRLRMSGGNTWAGLKGIQQALLGNMSGEAGDAFISMVPDNPALWRPGRMPWWDFVLKTMPQYRDDVLIRHQWAIFGGTEFQQSAEGRVLHYTTFFEDFLKGSAY